MWNTIKNFLREEDGLGTVEIVIIVAVLVAVAIMFRTEVNNFVKVMLQKAFPDPNSEALGDNNF